MSILRLASRDAETIQRKLANLGVTIEGTDFTTLDESILMPAKVNEDGILETEAEIQINKRMVALYSHDGSTEVNIAYPGYSGKLAVAYMYKLFPAGSLSCIRVCFMLTSNA